MDFAGDHYYAIHRMLLTSVGLWPYQNWKIKKIQIVISSIILVSSVFVQLMKFVTTEYSLDLLLRVLSFSVPCMVFVLKYVSFCISAETVSLLTSRKSFAGNEVGKLMQNVISDWHLLTAEVELEIIKRHSRFGRLCTLLFTLAVYSALCIYMFVQFIPNFLDIVAPRNESRPHNIPITAEYFADQQKYYLPILLHIDIIAFVGFTTVMSTESLFITFVQHAIGMFEIARIEHAFDEILNINTPKKKCTYCTKIINAMGIHVRAIKFVEFLRNSFDTSYFFLLFLGVTSLSVNLLRLFSATRFLSNIEELITAALFVLGHIYYIFLGNYTGQKLIDHSTDIFHRIYGSQWYIAPPHAQKLLLPMMQRGVKGTFISLGGVFVASLEGFATIFSMSLSYFTVMRSVR